MRWKGGEEEDRERERGGGGGEGGGGRTLEMKMKGSNIWPEETAARQSVNTSTGGPLLLFLLFLLLLLSFFFFFFSLSLSLCFPSILSFFSLSFCLIRSALKKNADALVALPPLPLLPPALIFPPPPTTELIRNHLS